MTTATAAPGRAVEDLNSEATRYLQGSGHRRIEGARDAASVGVGGLGRISSPVQRVAVTPDAAPVREERVAWVAFACYVVAVVSLAVSLNTSWRFFERVLHIPTGYGERYVMFAVAELALVVCGGGMAVNVHRDGRPGSFRMIVWAMCAAMAYMAWTESTPHEAIGRILLGPVLGTVMLHLGLGLELRTRHQHTSTLARMSRELRERCLSRLGLADDGRDAAQRTRDRKAYSAAALSRPRRWLWSRQARLERALLAAGVADDLLMRDRMLARLAVVQHAQELSALTQPSPWNSAPIEQSAAPAAQQEDHAVRPARSADMHIASRTAHPGADAGCADSPAQARRIDARALPDAHCTSGWGPQRAAVGGAHASHTAADLDLATALAASSAVSRERMLTAVRDPEVVVSRDRRPRAGEGLDSAAVERHRAMAESLVREGVTAKPPELVATILAEREAGTRPSTIGRQYRVHHTTVGRILDAAAQKIAG